jgi:LacI family transcriptional regulator
MIRLKDIAERAGVSIMTVSKALRDEPDVSGLTRTRVRLLAQEMGYVPDSDGARFAQPQNQPLRSADPVAGESDSLQGWCWPIQERAFELGYDVLLGYTLSQF